MVFGTKTMEDTSYVPWEGRNVGEVILFLFLFNPEWNKCSFHAN